MLASGSRLGPYEIVAPLGAGGMGEVYRARDPRLSREVAIKVLPPEVASDPERLRRFEQEAKAASAIHHPNLLTVFDVGDEGGVVFLVTELLSGEPLRELVRRGPVPPRRTIEIAAQLARGLAAAHDQGIVHRDLKPENLYLTKDGQAKILDFGLARIERPELAGDFAHGSTVLETSAGTVLGTVGYMAPEQVRGERADARSDLFSLGVVLHEMLAGANPFRRGSVVESLNAILKEEAPDLTAASPASATASSPELARIVARLLQKEPGRRFRSAHDLAFALEGASESRSGARIPSAGAEEPAFRRSTPRLLPLSALALLLTVGGAAYWLGHRGVAQASRTAARFEIAPPAKMFWAANTVENVPLAVSPDGTQLAFVVLDGEGSRIWLRGVDELEGRQLPGTEGAFSLTWSPDGRSIAFFTSGKLRRLELAGGSPVPICDVAPGMGHSASWGTGGDILFASVAGEAIRRVPAMGGVAQTVVEADGAHGEYRVVWPRYLPDSRGFLYSSRRENRKYALMLVEGSGPPRQVAELASRVETLGNDWLLFARDGALLAQKLDRAAGRLVGSPVSAASAVRYFFSSAWAGFAASPAGTIAYFAATNSSRLAWFDRSGRNLGDAGVPGDYLNLSISPDGRSVLVDRTQPELGTYDLWRLDLERGVETRLTSEPDADFDGVWLPDGKSIVYSTIDKRNPILVRRDLGSGSEERLLPGEAFQSATDISSDGRLLAYIERGSTGKFHALTMPLEGDRRATDLLPDDAEERNVRFSPDGRFVAYISDLSGDDEAYVAPLARPGASMRISKAGAAVLRWSRDGREIVFLDPKRALVSVPVRLGAEIELGTPVTLFELPEGLRWLNFDVSPDGRRFLAIVRERSAGSQPATAILGWDPEARR